ncbi:MAG: hypothetical protein BLITH_1244 [Brockia lithotrophica]|uniref:Uncharacterized protein n=1 Tax=Brockia lithotrophica TaxID=933949 RepID=A0A2T5G5Z6_9BACL|nr:MAG: hypothetical protein BLITH_1244 [Brockia lithotrophica]
MPNVIHRFFRSFCLYILGMTPLISVHEECSPFSDPYRFPS